MTTMRPAVSTFSDHIVVSYPLQPLYDAGSDEQFTAYTVLYHFSKLLASIAAAALRIGFLVRGGATIGKLYHTRGVVFGEALIASSLEPQCIRELSCRRNLRASLHGSSPN